MFECVLSRAMVGFGPVYSWNHGHHLLVVGVNVLPSNYAKCTKNVSFQHFYCPFGTLGKTVFAWRFILNENILSWLTTLLETICLFCFCVLFSNLYPKIKFTAKNLSDLCNYHSKKNFWIFLSKKIFFTCLCWIWIIDVSQQYFENFRKTKQMELHENMPPCHLPNRFLHNLHVFLLWEKVKIFDFLKTND